MYILLVAVSVLAVLLAAAVAWRVLRSRGGSGEGSAAYRRAAGLAVATVRGYRDAAASDPDAAPEELRIRALVESSGRPEAEIRALMAEAKKASILHTSLRMLTTRVAAERERSRAGTADARWLSTDVADAQRAVAANVPDEL